MILSNILRGLCFFVILWFLSILLPIQLNAQTADTSPPELVEFSFTPTTVDVSTSVQYVTINARMTDDLSGSRQPRVYFRSPSGAYTEMVLLASRPGTPTDKPYDKEWPVLPGTETGTWYVVYIDVEDEIGNQYRYLEEELIALGFPTKLEVVSTVADTSPPELVEFSFTPTTVDVSTSVQYVTINARMTDDLSGSRQPRVYFRSPSGAYTEMVLLASRPGTPTDKPYDKEWPVLPGTETGTWYVVYIDVEDEIGNQYRYLEEELIALGFPTKLEVVSTVADTSPPELVEFSFTPTTVDVSTSVQYVTINARMTDDLSGSRQPRVYFRSPSGAYTEMVLLASRPGTPTDKPYDKEWPVLPGTETGTWYVVYIDVEDEIGNQYRYLEEELIALGFPTKLEVVSETTIDNILNFFYESVDNGSLVGIGKKPWLEKLRLYLMQEMLESAKELIEHEKPGWACFTLKRAFVRCDSDNRPPDFVVGDAVTELNGMISELIEELGGE